jgi:hypothetical protein
MKTIKKILGTIILGSFLTTSLYSMEVKEYSGTYQMTNKLKQEISEIEDENRCNIQINNPTQFKYFEDMMNINNDGILGNVFSALTQTNARITEKEFGINTIITLENDIKCLIKEGAIISSGLSKSRDTIYDSRNKGLYFKDDFNTKKNLYIDPSIKSLYEKAIKEAETLDCRLNGSLEKINCNKGKFLFDITTNSLTYKGTLLYSPSDFYGYNLTTGTKKLKVE